ncbi:hypothetical protein D3C87_151720 [compost metagenome]
MEDFNNIEFDPIPEGLEFNESYMQDAFALYDAEKQKQRRRILIWWLTSALGFASILLVGIYFLSKGDASNSADKKATTEKMISAQNSSAKNSISSNGIKNQGGTISTTADSNMNHHGNDGLHSKKKTTTRFLSAAANKNDHVFENKKKQSFRHKQTLAQFKVSRKSSNSFKNKNPRTKIVTDFKTEGMNRITETDSISPVSASLTTHPTVPDNPNEKVEIDSNRYLDLDNLPSKPALLAFNRDSISKQTIDSLSSSLQTEVEPRKHQLFLNLGVNTMFGMKELQHRVIFKESIGLSYNYQLSRKIGIGVGLEYHSIPRISYRRIVGDTTNSSKTTTILNKTTLNYISLFPQVNFQLWPHHKVTAGLGIEYLLVDPSERYEIENYTDESPKRTNSKLYYSTFNRFNFSVSIGYVYQFSRFMSIQALYHYGFTDITKNNSFNKTFDRNSRLQLGLKIKLY